MKGKINKEGYLWIERAEKMKKQRCPFAHHEFRSNCGDWCPLFDEPAIRGKKWLLEICMINLLEFDSFTDERG